jgi:ATP-dependent DNA helicase DinG
VVEGDGGQEMNVRANFPFPSLCEKQSLVLDEIGSALSSGYKYIILEAPTGFGKSPVAIAVALTLGSSYICTSTKNLQTQYNRDFPFVMTAKGKGNFMCEVKDDFIRAGTYRCTVCDGSRTSRVSCPHKTVEYGPCMSDKDFDCKYKPMFKDYYKVKEGREQQVLLNRSRYLREYPTLDGQPWRPCQYFHQLNIALAASHSVLNYSMLFGLLHKRLPSRELLVLDEAHLLEMEVVRFRGLSISQKKWRKYISDLKLRGGYDVQGWVKELEQLREKTSELLGKIGDQELLVEASQDLEKLEIALESLSTNPDNWLVSNIKIEGKEITRAELKPLDVAPYCKDLFQNNNRTLMMSATILDTDTFCRSIDLDPKEVRMIKVGSDFPVQNRPIYPLNVAHLNYSNLQKDEVKRTIASAIDKIMTVHKSHKGIIHTTSYEQLEFIRQNISRDNRHRLLVTDPELERDDVIIEHTNSNSPTVLISPSLHIGLDLKDDLSRFQVITKVPYLSLGDKWIDCKRRKSDSWYIWQTALRLVQGYGRSIRNKDDWATTYVLDSLFTYFISKNRNILPAWFTDAIK